MELEARLTRVLACAWLMTVVTASAVFAADPYLGSCRQTCGKSGACVRAAKAVFLACAHTQPNPNVCFANMRTARDACEAAVNACRARCPACAAAAARDFSGCETAADAAGCIVGAVSAFHACLGASDASACTDYRGLASAEALARSPYSDAEAEVLALEASGAFVAAPDVYARIRDDLDAIRRAHGEVAGIAARASWNPNELLVSFDAEGKTMVDAGTYADWTCLNLLYDLTSTRPLTFGSSFVLEFAHRMNSPLLAAEYARLPHVTGAGSNSLIGDGDDVCAAIDGSTYTYVFDAGSGDCLSGCIDHTYWGFTTSPSGAITSLGTWSRGEGEAPAWFVANGACTRWL